MSLVAFYRDLTHWSQLGPVGAFSTSLESLGSTQRGKGIVRIWWTRLWGNAKLSDRRADALH
jgi:hypothetical protein